MTAVVRDTPKPLKSHAGHLYSYCFKFLCILISQHQWDPQDIREKVTMFEACRTCHNYCVLQFTRIVENGRRVIKFVGGLFTVTSVVSTPVMAAQVHLHVTIAQ